MSALRPARAVGIAGLCAWLIVAAGAPFIAPNPPRAQFAERAYAPPMRIHVRDASGFHAPFVYRQHPLNLLERTYSEDRTRRAALRWLLDGRLLSVTTADGPLLLLGADSVGRDVFSRLVYGASLSLGVTVLGTLGALLLGAVVGSLAGVFGGRIDICLMTLADFMVVLPGAYLVLVLRASLPAVLSTSTVFWSMAMVFAVAAWPHVARGVRAIVASERHREYAEAARAMGAGPVRLIAHLLPAARGFLAVESMLLMPALLVAEATVSYLGLGFPEPVPSWGTMLYEASDIANMSSAPWLLAPAAALFTVILSVNAAGGAQARDAWLGARRSRTRSSAAHPALS
jgi:peptide/nickel transport system permease protein